MREPKPFFRRQTGTWYVQVGTKQHTLGPDEQVAVERHVTVGCVVEPDLRRQLAAEVDSTPVTRLLRDSVPIRTVITTA